MVSSRPEPEWDDREQTLVLAMQVYKDSLCPMCGLPFEVCTATENEGKFKVEGPVRCHKSTALAIASSKLDPKIPHSESLLFGASLLPGG
jgi:hypothetical protein